MAAAAGHLQGLGREDRQLLEAWLVEFDQGWHEDRLAGRVRELPGPGHPLRLPAIIELVKIDLEKQWHRGQRKTVENYLQENPELGTAATVPVDLVLAEYQARRHLGEAINLAAFARRFPGQAEELQRRAAQMADTFATLPPLAVAPTLAELPHQFGRYRILRKLGQGGMGAVYLAHDSRLDRPVALKVPHLEATDNPELLQRFYREAQAVAALHHPNLCPVYDVGAIQKIPYFTMAYLEGQPLSARIQADQPWPQERAAVLVRQLALALAEAHAHGVLHRDLKPANVIINARDEPIVTDFGLAWRFAANDVRLTRQGMLVGTPAYMSPEQVLGDMAAMGPGCDIYSLGVVLYELLTGQLPFQGSLTEVLVLIQTQPPRPPTAHRPDLHPLLDTICLKALAKRPGKRYRTMLEMAAALDGYLEDGGSTPAKPVQRHRPWIAGALVLGVAALVGTAMWRPWEASPVDPVIPEQQPQKKPPNPGPAAEKQLREIRCFEGHSQGLISVAFSTEPGRIISVGADRTLRWWNADDGKELTARRQQFGELTEVKLLSGDGRRLVTAFLQNLTVLDLDAGQELRRLNPGSPHVHSIALSPDGRRLIAGTWTLSGFPVKVWDLETGTKLSQFTGHLDRANKVTAVALAPDGRLALSAGKDGVRLWQVETAKEVRHLGRDAVTCMTFTSDSRRFLCGEATGVILLWEVDKNAELRRLEGHSGAVTCVAISQDGRRALSGSADRTVRLWDLESGKELKCLHGHEAGITCVTFSPDQHRFLSGSQDKTVRLWGTD